MARAKHILNPRVAPEGDRWHPPLENVISAILRQSQHVLIPHFYQFLTLAVLV